MMIQLQNFSLASYICECHPENLARKGLARIISQVSISFAIWIGLDVLDSSDFCETLFGKHQSAPNPLVSARA